MRCLQIVSDGQVCGGEMKPGIALIGNLWTAHLLGHCLNSLNTNGPSSVLKCVRCGRSVTQCR